MGENISENITRTELTDTPPYFGYPRNSTFDNFLIALVFINGLASVLASISNAVVIYTFTKTPSLRTPSNLLLFGLFLSDFIVSAIVQPSFCFFKYFELKRHVSLHSLFRTIYVNSITVLASMSFLLVTTIAADRFLAIHLNLRYTELITNQRYSVVLIVIAIISVLFVILRAVNQLTFLFKIVSGSIGVVAFFSNAFFYVQIWKSVRRHNAQIESQQIRSEINLPKYKKSVRVMAWIISAFVLCYVPIAIMNIILMFKKGSIELRSAYPVAETLVMFNSLFDPIIYCWKISCFRSAIMAALRLHRSRPVAVRPE